jgi:hypothetical protein
MPVLKAKVYKDQQWTLLQLAGSVWFKIPLSYVRDMP